MPATPVEPVEEIFHGEKIVDPYRWLEDGTSPRTRAWLEQQIDYTNAQLKAAPGRARISKRLEELLRVDSVGLPWERGGRYFYSRRNATQDLPVLYMRQGRDGAEHMLLDPHPWSPDRTVGFQVLEVSHDGKWLIYGLRQGGEDELEIHVLDVDTKQELPDRLPRARYSSVQLLPDKSAFYYSLYHKEEGPSVRLHRLGTAAADDREIFGEGYGPGIGIGCELSEDGRSLLLSVHYGAGGARSDVYYQDLRQDGPPRLIVREIDALFDPFFAGQDIVIRTNWQAPRGKLMRVDLQAGLEPKHWRELVPEAAGAIQSVSVAGERIVVRYLENVLPKIKFFTVEGQHTGELPLADLSSISGLSGRWESQELFYQEESFHQPATIRRFDLTTRETEIWHRSQIPFDGSAYSVSQVWITSRDGTRVPMFLAHRKDLPRDGNRPTLLYGYGGFNISLTPNFSALAAVWMELGGVYAVANLRGGGEFGESWHEAGMLSNKQNTFDDFLAASEWLIRERYTQSKRLCWRGGSNGGLLVGAALTQRPELCQAVVCSVPLLDMLRYHRFLVARFWVPEYGSSEDRAQYEVLKRYSPYHRVQAGTKYPAVMFVTGDADTRVDPNHARKMTARLQAATGSDRPILLRYDIRAGHAGGQPVNKTLEQLTDEVQFLAWQSGLILAEPADTPPK